MLAKRTNEPAAARKSHLKLRSYAVDLLTIGGSRKISDCRLPFTTSELPGQKKFQTGNLKACRSLAGSGPIHGCGQSLKPTSPHFVSAVILAGVCRAVLGSFGG